MNVIFADTSYFIALLDRDDSYHAAARSFARQNSLPLITSSAIVLDVGAYFSYLSGRPFFLKTLSLIENGLIGLVHVDEDLQRRGTALFRSRQDKEWSLTDCISFTIMQDKAITDAATTDVHFEQAQFKALLRHLHPGTN